MKKEKIFNIPNFVTALRFPLTIFALITLLEEYPVAYPLVFFGLAAFTDFLDGFFARRYDQVTRFGERFDQYADRFTTILFIFGLLAISIQDLYKVILLFMISSREIIGTIGLIIRHFRKKPAYKVEFIGKVQTAIQFVTICLFLLWVDWIIYPVFLTFVVGIFAGLSYVMDSLK